MCEYCGGVLELSVIPALAFLPYCIHRTWHRLRCYLMPDPYVIEDYYHNTIIPEWYPTYKAAEQEVKRLQEATGRKTFEIIQLPRGPM